MIWSRILWFLQKHIVGQPDFLCLPYVGESSIRFFHLYFSEEWVNWSQTGHVEVVVWKYRHHPTGLSWASKNVYYWFFEILIFINPICAMGSIIDVFHNFWKFGSNLVLFARFFKNELKNQIFWMFTYYIFLETWGWPLFRYTKIFGIRGHLRLLEVVKGH